MKQGIKFLQIPTLTGPGYPEWKNKLLQIVEKYRVLTKHDYGIKFRKIIFAVTV